MFDNGRILHGCTGFDSREGRRLPKFSHPLHARGVFEKKTVSFRPIRTAAGRIRTQRLPGNSLTNRGRNSMRDYTSFSYRRAMDHSGLGAVDHRDEEEAIRIANDTPYGLAANVASGDPERALRVAARLRAGQVRINDAAGDFETPFGGYKQSGNGREGGAEGFGDFVETKSVVV